MDKVTTIHPYIRRAQTLWPGLVLVLGIGLVGFAVRTPVKKTELVAAPSGWTRITETGGTIAIAFDGPVVYAGGKDGLFQLDRKTSRVLGKVKLPVDPIHIRSLCVDKPGSIWIGHIDGLIHLQKGQVETWNSKNGLPANRVNVVRSFDGVLYVGTGAGLVTRVGSEWKVVPYQNRLASKVINTCYQSNDGALWVGSSSDPKGGLSRVDNGKVKVWRTQDGLPHAYVQDIVEPEKGEIWIATGQFEAGGALKMTAKSTKTLHKKDGLAGEKVRSLGVDSQGGIWFGSENDGLAVLREGKLSVWTTRNGLPHNEITCIRVDTDGSVWLATLNGVVKINKGAEPNRASLTERGLHESRISTN